MKRLALALAALLLTAGCTPAQMLAHDRQMGYPLGHTELSLQRLAAHQARQAQRSTVWDRLRQCEAPDWAGGWHANTGNGFFGGLQFTLQSWRWVGGTGYPHHHSRETQTHFAERLLARQGWGAWPACSRKLGLR